MHYQITDSCIVKSENAALTTKQPNMQIVKYISNLPNNIVALDYGCGKLRHSIFLYKKCSLLVVIDSDIQITRIQKIDNMKLNVIDYIDSKMPTALAFPISDNRWKKYKYDFVLCTNVLSAIPSFKEREIILTNIKNNLKSEGKALISVQYRNSYFKSYKENSNAKEYLDGWIIKKGTFYSFYGIIQPKDLTNLCIQQGFKILNKRLIDGSIYLEVSV